MRFQTFLLALLTMITTIVYAEGTKQLSPTNTDTTGLAINSVTYGNFGSVNSLPTSRLNFRIGNPAQESIHIGLSRAHATGTYDVFHDGAFIDYYYRVMNANGNAITGWLPINATTANLTSHQLCVDGPAALTNTGGYVSFVVNLADTDPSGDYYIEFSTLNNDTNGAAFYIPYFDITVGTKGTGAAAIDGRVFSRNWAFVAPPTLKEADAGFDYFDRDFKGNFYVYSQLGFVSKIDFLNAGFRPLVFNMAFNEDGTNSKLDVTQNLKSVNEQKRTNPQHEVFLNDPDPLYYPNGIYGTVIENSEYPKLIGCASNNDYAVRVASTQPGVMEILFDQNQPGGVAGIYEPGTTDRIIMVRVDARPGEKAPFIREIPWDGLDGQGSQIASTANLNIETTYSQVAYNLPIYDAEYLINGFDVSLHRPAPPAAYTLVMQYDDSNIPDANGLGNLMSNLNGCGSGCHRWSNLNFGDQNTINTLWYARREAITKSMTLQAPDCGCDPATDLTMSGIAYADNDGNFIQNGPTETGLANVVVSLYKDTNADRKPTQDEFLESQQTSLTGEYSFSQTVGMSTNTDTTSTAETFNDGLQFNDNWYPQYCAVGGYNGTNDAFVAALRFENIELPAGTTIQNAELLVESAGRRFGGPNGAVAITIEGVLDANAAPFSPTNLPNDQTYTTNSASFTAPAAWTLGTAYTVTGLTALVNEVVTLPSFEGGNAIALRLSSTGAAAHASFVQADTDVARAPRLKLTVNGPDLPANYIITVSAASAPAGLNFISDTLEFANFNQVTGSNCNGVFRAAADRDGDSVIDANDLDNDNDGIPDAEEKGNMTFSPTGDQDGDGIPNYLDLNDANFTGSDANTADLNNDGIVDGYDADMDGIPDAYDLDSDDDGIVDLIEAGGVDTDGNGIVDNTADADGDGLADTYDNNDSDGPTGNGIDTTSPATSALTDPNATGTSLAPDADSDGYPNYIDVDADNDGIPDLVEAYGSDADGDGRVDNATDADQDGIADVVDADNDNTSVKNDGNGALVTTDAAGNVLGTDPRQQLDLDADGFPNFLDRDSDNDGISDLVEAGVSATLDANQDGRLDSPVDLDGDGFSDEFDTNANDGSTVFGSGNPNGTSLGRTNPDSDGDGSYINEGMATGFTGSDNDGLPDYLDLDSDNDGIADVVEQAGGNLSQDDAGANLNGQMEHAAGVDYAVNTNYAVLDSDGDGVPDYRDIDADNDGIPDNLEAVCTGCPTANGYTSADANHNGMSDAFEGLTATNTSGGTNIGVTPVDKITDSNGVDYLDTDTDDDGALDYSEGFDFNGNGQSRDDYSTIAANYEANNGNPMDYTSADTDNDGLPNWLDNQPTVAGFDAMAQPPFLNPSSSYWVDINNNGLADLVDQAAGGTRTTLPDADGINDADWRDAAEIAPLPVELISFAVQAQLCDISVYWSASDEIDFSHYEVQTSTDGSKFNTVRSTPASDAATSVNQYTESLAGNNGQLYVRLAMVDLDATTTYSQVVAVRTACANQQTLSVFPNPVTRGESLTVTGLQTGQVTLLDITGRQVLNYQITGDETLRIPTEELRAGLYVLHVEGQPAQRIVVQ